jgi:Protein of unknown function (DUF2934)
MLHEEDRIRTRAHQIWERQGRPDDLAATHWQMAQEELAREDSQTGSAELERQLANGAAETAIPAAANDGLINGKATLYENAALAASSTRPRSRRKQSAAS